MSERDDRHREERSHRSRHDDRDRDRDRERRDRGDRDRDRDRERYSRRVDERDRYGGRRGGYDDAPPPRRYRDDDRGARRPHDDERPPRRRDDDRGDRRGGGRRQGTPERRSPTPEGAVPLSQRKRKATGWDVHAPGYEQYSAMQAKQTGLFNLPGANRTQIPPILGIPGLPPPIPVASFGMGIGGNPNLSRQSRRLYIGSITPEINEHNLAEFFNSKMTEMNIGTGGPGNPVLAVQCNYEKNYAFVEFRSADDATAAMAFDGIIFLNGPLKIRRPKDYDISVASAPMIHVPGIISTNVPDSANKIFVGGLPAYLNEEQVQELLTSFGELKAFNLVRETGTGASKQGYAFFEYVDPNVTDVAIQSLNGMELGDRFLVVQRASVGAKDGTIPNLPAELMPAIPKPIMPAGQTDTSGDARVLLMLNMVTPDDLVDDDEYGDLLEDIKEECSKFGPVEDLRVPRPVKKEKKWAPGEGGREAAVEAQRADEAAGVGRVYVKFVDAKDAAVALKSLAGRSFAGRSIIATLLNDESQTNPPLHVVFAPQPEAPPPLPAPPMEE
uniref:Splicing factor U2AF subunit n=1 Tax=Schizophyllum commune (strain H4-8 / FGSC 9210) TaxID=578458 RepID=D8Q0G7_SCHCM